MKYNNPLNSIARLIFAIFAICYAGHALAIKYQITGPYSKDNLSFYLIHGEDRIKEQNFLTLGEALQTNQIKVYETSHVNQLSIENLSKTRNIYIQAGDIVKGGKQDRVFSTDMVLEPGSGKVNITSFCVESGRWHKRGHESATEFNSSTKKLSSKELRLAARLKQNQSEVWAEVAKTQRKLSEKVGQDITDKSSTSSLQLALENKILEQKVAGYRETFLPLLEGKHRAIGYAYAINGQLNTADIYANHVLLDKLWPKIVDAAATESVGEYDEKRTITNPTPARVEEWMATMNNHNLKTREIKPGLKQDTVETDTDVRFDTYSGSGTKKKVYRQNYIKKKP